MAEDPKPRFEDLHPSVQAGYRLMAEILLEAALDGRLAIMKKESVKDEAPSRGTRRKGPSTEVHLD